MYGERKDLRFIAVLWLSTSFIHLIENEIAWAFNRFLESAYENHLQEQKDKWILNKRIQIINQILS